MENSSLPKITAVGTGLSPNAYTQKELLDLFKMNDPKVRSLFLNGSIERRYLTLPKLSTDGHPLKETQGDLLKKHAHIGLSMGRDAIINCLKNANAKRSEVRHICCVSSTGLLTPGFSALLIKDLGLRHDCSRLDIVGMGCNAGLNALSVVNAWAQANPGKLAILVCIETCSAAYVFDGTMRTSVVNSLFGDGAAAISVIKDKSPLQHPIFGPSILRFRSLIIPDTIDAMRYEWDESEGKFNFFLAPDVPYVVGAHATLALECLLENTGLRTQDIQHWLIHSGGKKVIDSIRINLGLTQHDVRHTIAILRNFGNVSSGSFLFSYERLLNEKSVLIGDYGIMMTMGPGSTIEMALLHWNELPLRKKNEHKYPCICN